MSQRKCKGSSCRGSLDVLAAILRTTCHRQAYQGDASVPRLAGQQAFYLAKTLMDLRSRSRANNPGMSEMMNLATPEQLAAMAAYLGGLQER
jgi:cytochrome c553